MTTDGRRICALAPEATMRIRFEQRQALLAQAPGATFYHRLRDKFGRCPTRRVTLGRSVGRRWYTCAVLLELRIENLLLIERAELRPGAG